EWQNSIRVLMDMPPVEGTRPFAIALVALSLLAAGVIVARLFRLTYRVIHDHLPHFLPPRVARLIGAVAAAFLFWSLIDGVLFRYLLSTIDKSFQQLDALVEPEGAPPADPVRSEERRVGGG